MESADSEPKPSWPPLSESVQSSPTRSSQVRVMSRRSEPSLKTLLGSPLSQARTCCRHRYAGLGPVPQHPLQAFDPAQRLAGRRGPDNLNQTRKAVFHMSTMRRKSSPMPSSYRDQCDSGPALGGGQVTLVLLQTVQPDSWNLKLDTAPSEPVAHRRPGLFLKVSS